MKTLNEFIKTVQIWLALKIKPTLHKILQQLVINSVLFSYATLFQIKYKIYVLLLNNLCEQNLISSKHTVTSIKTQQTFTSKLDLLTNLICVSIQS